MPKPTFLEPGSLRLADGAVSGETPMAYLAAWLRKRMPEYGARSADRASRILIVQAETGSGKSTVMPVGVLRVLRGDARTARRGAPGVVCTQPRVLTAMALAADVSADHSPWNPDIVLGETVGFQTGPVSNRPAAPLVYATAGVLAVQLRRQDDAALMDRYRVIVVDEAHERSLDSDLLLGQLRDYYARNAGNERLPFLILASATIDPARYAAYFGVGEANVVRVVGRQHPIAVRWPAAGTNDYPRAAAEEAARIHAENAGDDPQRADILIFVPGATEAASVVFRLGALNASDKAGKSETHKAPFLVLSINREVVNAHAADYALLFAPPDRLPLVDGRRPARRVIVSTVVAETGLTIDTLRYVIDCGWSRAREVYQPWGVEGLTTRPAAQSRVEQRKGRAGRLFPGEFRPLYTKNVYGALDEWQLPEIVLAGPAPVFLAVALMQQRHKLRTGEVSPDFRFEDIALPDPPPPEAFVAANAIATALGFVSARAELPDTWPPAINTNHMDNNKNRSSSLGPGLTGLGFIASAFSRVSMEGARVLLAGPVWGAAAADLLTAVAMFGTKRDSLLAESDEATQSYLEAILPPYLATRTTGGAQRSEPSKPLNTATVLAATLIADDYVEAILAFDAFARRLDQTEGDIAAVAAWCETSGFDYDALVELARRRDVIAEEMIVAGLDPLRAGDRRISRAAAGEFVDRLTRIKRCLYDGLRPHLLQSRSRGTVYETPQGTKVATETLARAWHWTSLGLKPPRWIVTDMVALRPASRRPEDKAPPLLYAERVGLVSVLDGYVDPDLDFAAPKNASEPEAKANEATLPSETRLLAYERVVRAVNARATGAPARSLFAQLSSEQLATVLTQRQQDLLASAKK